MEAGAALHPLPGNVLPPDAVVVDQKKIAPVLASGFTQNIGVAGGAGLFGAVALADAALAFDTVA